MKKGCNIWRAAVHCYLCQFWRTTWPRLCGHALFRPPSLQPNFEDHFGGHLQRYPQPHGGEKIDARLVVLIPFPLEAFPSNDSNETAAYKLHAALTVLTWLLHGKIQKKHTFPSHVACHVFGCFSRLVSMSSLPGISLSLSHTLSTYLSIYLSVYLSVCLSIHLSLCGSLYLSISLARSPTHPLTH